MTRLQTLNARLERLINGNRTNGWVRTKPDRYFKALTAIKTERIHIMRENDKKLDKSGYKVDFRNVLYNLANPL